MPQLSNSLLQVLLLTPDSCSVAREPQHQHTAAVGTTEPFTASLLFLTIWGPIKERVVSKRLALFAEIHVEQFDFFTWINVTTLDLKVIFERVVHLVITVVIFTAIVIAGIMTFATVVDRTIDQSSTTECTSEICNSQFELPTAT